MIPDCHPPDDGLFARLCDRAHAAWATGREAERLLAADWPGDWVDPRVELHDLSEQALRRMTSFPSSASGKEMFRHRRCTSPASTRSRHSKLMACSTENRGVRCKSLIMPYI
mmetsp:Transcript_45588/g.145470  ORF Transcript_45588/g.145470 Transcript_45588/m.145470 type:complete len:112 (-) Transcript_45588:1231-1566(-)